MPITALLPVMAALIFIGFALFCATKGEARSKHMWLIPALLSAAFLFFSISAVITEGLLSVWAEHTRNLWGVQIWLDLLLAVGIGWFFMAPQAKSLGMRPLPWLALIICTGCIGLLAMLARLLYLRQQGNKPAFAHQ